MKKPIRSRIKPPEAIVHEEGQSSNNPMPPGNEHSIASRLEADMEVEEPFADSQPSHEELREDLSISKDNEPNNQADNVANTREKIFCEICGKNFPSQKAKYGHLRMHPKETAKKETPTFSLPFTWKTSRRTTRRVRNRYDPVLGAEDLMYLCSGKGELKRRRYMEVDNANSDPRVNVKFAQLEDPGRATLDMLGNAVGSVTPEVQRSMDEALEMESDQEKERTTEFNAIDLADNDNGNKKISPTQEKDEFTEMTSDQVEETIARFRNSISNAIEFAGNVNENEKTVNTREKEQCIMIPSPESENHEEFMKTEAREKGKRNESEHDSIGPCSSHNCRICNKSFPTHQALGGHMASHNNKGKDIQGESSSKGSKKNKGGIMHRCEQCAQEYDTGQSLGGHMRKHYDPDKKKSLYGSQIAKKGTGKSSSANTMETTDHSQIVEKDAGLVIGESCSSNSIEETGRLEAVKEGGSSSANAMEGKSVTLANANRVQAIKEGELSSANATKETYKLQAIEEGESSLANAVEETNRVQNVKEGESSTVANAKEEIDRVQHINESESPSTNAHAMAATNNKNSTESDSVTANDFDVNELR